MRYLAVSFSLTFGIALIAYGMSGTWVVNLWPVIMGGGLVGLGVSYIMDVGDGDG